MFRSHRHLTWLVFFVLALTASLPWWSHSSFTTRITLQTAILIVLAFAWLIGTWWWAQTDLYLSFVLSLSWWKMWLDQLGCLAVLVGAVWGAWWVSCLPWLDVSPIAHLLFLLVLAIGGISWFIEAIVSFWVPVAYDIGEITIAHYRSQRANRRRRGF